MQKIIMKLFFLIYETALTIAVRQNNVKIVQLLVNFEGIDINSKLIFIYKFFNKIGNQLFLLHFNI